MIWDQTIFEIRRFIPLSRRSSGNVNTTEMILNYVSKALFDIAVLVKKTIFV